LQAFGKVYSTPAEEEIRFAIFSANLASINAHNAQVPPATYQQGVNAFTDLTNAEFKAMYTSPYRRTTPRNEKFIYTISNKMYVSRASLPLTIVSAPYFHPGVYSH